MGKLTGLLEPATSDTSSSKCPSNACFDNLGIELQENVQASTPCEKSDANQGQKIEDVESGKGQDETGSEVSQNPEYLNYGEEDEMEIYGYVRCRRKTILTWMFIVLTLGLARLVFHWWPRLMLYSTHRRSPIIKAEKVLVIEQYQQKYKRYHVKTVFTVSAELFRFASMNDTRNLNQSKEDISLQEESQLTIEGIASIYKMEYDTRRSSNANDVTILERTVPSRWAKAFLLTKPILIIRRLLLELMPFHNKSSRTNQIFLAAGLPEDQITEATKVWDQKLEQELLSIESPKLAIPKPNGSIRETHSVRVFTCKKLRYLWDDQFGAFVKLQGLDTANTHELHTFKGLSIFQQCQRRLIYGNNEINVKVNGIVSLLFLEVLNPFYVFQIFSVALWLSDNYVYFSIAIIIMSMLGIGTTIVQTRKNQQKLRSTVQTCDTVTVSRGSGIYETISSEYLVPGDVIVIPPHGCTMHCDAALLSGNCIVNESMLTGESVPVTKIPLPNRPNIDYDVKEHARHTLFCGTSVMQTRYYGQERVVAVVLRSGFLTAKGNLVRSIMYPPPVDYKFERDSYKFVAVLACIAAVGFIISVITKMRFHETWRNIIIDSLDLITIVVPPALPAAMTVGRVYAQRRLKALGIYCISPRAINVSGSIDCVCFDKTGTLTEEGLDLWGAVPSEVETRTLGNNRNEGYASFQTPVRDVKNLSLSPLFVGMTTCHSLTLIDGALIGDPLDLKMFEWTGWSLEEPGVADNEKFDKIAPTVVRPKMQEMNDTENRDTEIGVIRQFPFSSSLQRMSVISRTLGASEFELYCKGSPEMITSLSRKETVPKNFTSVLEAYTQEGFRVIAIGYKKLSLNYAKAQRVLREEVENDLHFLGLIVLDNRLKPATTTEMMTLKRAGIRTIMVTGDNMLTALSVARECGMVEQSAKVIVINAQSAMDDSGKTKPFVTFTMVNKQSLSGTQSPVSTASVSTIEQNLINVEAGMSRYHFAISGSAFSVIKAEYPDLLPKVLARGTVFARMSPAQKQQLVEHLQGMDYFVAMCGDGANDCGALKAAHCGISLSEAESSVASPFTSTEPNIKCVSHIIREGRAALVTSFGIFKYMAVYSLTQFVSVIILYTIQSNLGDFQFLYIDLFLISTFALFFGKTQPYGGPLEKKPPSASLVSALPIASILCHMTSVVCIQAVAFLFVQHQPWFTPYEHKEDYYAGFENYTLFSISMFQYIIMAIVFSKGKPYRKALWTNHGLLTSLVSLTALSIYIVLGPCSWLMDRFQLLLPPIEFRFILLAIALVNFILSLIIEYFIVNVVVAAIFNDEKSKRQKEYVLIERKLAGTPEWPPLSSPYSINEDDDKLIPGCEIGMKLAGNSNVSVSHHDDDSSSNNNNVRNETRKFRRHSSVSIPIGKVDHFKRPRSHNSSCIVKPSSMPPSNGFLASPRVGHHLTNNLLHHNDIS